jgi:hypothetical protein
MKTEELLDSALRELNRRSSRKYYADKEPRDFGRYIYKLAFWHQELGQEVHLATAPSARELYAIVKGILSYLQAEGLSARSDRA